MTNRNAFSHGPTPGVQPHHFTDYLRVISKRRWTAGLAFVVVFAYGAINTLKQTPIYEAQAQLLIEKEARRATSVSAVLEDQSSYYEDDFYPTQQRILLSRALGALAVKRMRLDKPTVPTPATGQSKPSSGGIIGWVKDLIGAPKAIEPPPPDESSAEAAQISGFMGGLGVTPVRQTRFTLVKYQSADPDFARRAADAVAEAYIDYVMKARDSGTEEASTYLTSVLAGQKKKMEESDAALQSFLIANGTVAPNDRANTVVTRLADLSGQVTLAQNTLIQKQINWTQIQQLQKDDKLDTYPGIMLNADISKLSADLRGLQTQRAQQAANFGEKMDEVKNLDARIQDLTGKLQVEKNKVVEAVRNDFLQAESVVTSLKASLAEQNRAALSDKSVGMRYAALEQVSKGDHALYDSLLDRAKQTGVSSQFKGTNIQIVDKAQTPQSPIYPQTRRDLTISFAEGLLLALGLVFGFEYLDSRIKTPDELKTHLGLPFLGIVPVVSGKGRSDEALLLHNDVPPGFIEAVRAIRTSIIFSCVDEGARAIVITSTAPSEGKTLVSTNLAVALAQAGQLTLIVDCDMRRPRVHEVFHRPQEPGLSNVLVGTTRLRDAIRTTSVPNLSLLPAGHIPPNPAELLGSTKYLELLEELRSEYEWVLLDAPPVMAVTDAAILAHTATGVVFVVGAEMTSRRNAIAAIEQLAAARGKFIGGILNRVNLQRHSYYYSPYYRKDYAQVYERASKYEKGNKTDKSSKFEKSGK